jgi:hypothetical protein
MFIAGHEALIFSDPRTDLLERYRLRHAAEFSPVGGFNTKTLLDTRARPVRRQDCIGRCRSPSMEIHATTCPARFGGDNGALECLFAIGDIAAVYGPGRAQWGK